MNVSEIDCTHIVPIGGVGEFGANATIIETPDTCILIDFGLMFPPDKRRPGVEFYINDPDLLLERFPRLSAIFVTHGHEDHIGGLGFLLEKRLLPIITTAYTARLIQASLEYHDLRPEIRVAPLGDPVFHGDLSVTFIGVTHSIVGAAALAVRTPDGTVLHSGDFKVDPLPGDNHLFQSDAFKALGDEGVDLLIMDSTNAGRTGFCPSEYTIEAPLRDLIESAPGRVFLTTFSSHMPRILRLTALARAAGRKIAFVGRSFRKHFRACLDTAYMGTEAASVVVDEDTAATLPPHQVLYVVAGSQAEARSSLASIASGGFRGLRFHAGDRLIFSSRSIPGNERQVMLFCSEMERRGIEVITGHSAEVHTSGHAYREDIAYLLNLTRPHCVAPIHGEFHHLLAHHRWLLDMTADSQEVLLLEDGDLVTLRDGKARNTGKVPVAMIPIDGNQNRPVSTRVLKERRDMMYTGMVLINAVTTAEGFHFEVHTHGICEAEEGDRADALLAELNALALDVADAHGAREKILRTTRTLMKRLAQGRPLTKLVLDGRIVH